jgi:hypothetical protein
MKKIAALVSTVILATIVGCASTNRLKESVAASNAIVLLVTAKNMNASMSSNELNELMQSEVAAFSQSLKKNLEADGKEVTLRVFESASEKDIARQIAGMPKKPGLLIQAYWAMKQDNAMYILADTLKLQYRVSGNSVYFATLFRKEYLSIGLTAKPSDTPENHALHYSKQLRQAYP